MGCFESSVTEATLPQETKEIPTKNTILAEKPIKISHSEKPLFKGTFVEITKKLESYEKNLENLMIIITEGTAREAFRSCECTTNIKTGVRTLCEPHKTCVECRKNLNEIDLCAKCSKYISIELSDNADWKHVTDFCEAIEKRKDDISGKIFFKIQVFLTSHYKIPNEIGKALSKLNKVSLIIVEQPYSEDWEMLVGKKVQNKKFS